jgi:hypothetical protein
VGQLQKGLGEILHNCFNARRHGLNPHRGQLRIADIGAASACYEADQDGGGTGIGLGSQANCRYERETEIF